MLMLVKGRFNLERLAAAGAQSYGGVPLIGDGRGSTGVVALLDANTAMAGDLPLVREAIDRRGHGGIPAELAARVEAVRNRYDIWGLGDRPAGYVPPTSVPKGFENVDRFQFGILFNHGPGTERRDPLHLSRGRGEAHGHGEFPGSHDEDAAASVRWDEVGRPRGPRHATSFGHCSRRGTQEGHGRAGCRREIRSGRAEAQDRARL